MILFVTYCYCINTITMTQTGEPPYCFEYMIALVNVDKFPLPFFSRRLSEVLLPADSMRTDGFSFTGHFRSL